MVENRASFGSFFKHLIKEAGLTQVDFYRQLGIKKPYFYDIISGRVNPPPPHLQFKAMGILQSNEETKAHFFNLAAKERGELPADISKIIADNPKAIQEIRNDYGLLINKRRKD